MQLNTVVLPAPFGPMTEGISPRRAPKDRSFTAVRPPKRMTRCWTSSSGSATAFGHQFRGDLATLAEGDARGAAGDEAARAQDHDQDQGQAEDQHAVVLQAPEQLDPADHDDGGQRGAE